MSRLVHVARNLVMAGNTVLIGPSVTDTANAWGALYLGCTPLTGPNNLILINSTISANEGDGTGSTAGIWGDARDHLTLENSILAGDSGGGELFRFSGTGGSVTVNHTDLCHGTSPFAGTGNICADPRLVNPAGNVRETYAGPTIDRGLNTLVPTGLTTDIYGARRIAPKLSGGTPKVDMGCRRVPDPERPHDHHHQAGGRRSLQTPPARALRIHLHRDHRRARDRLVQDGQRRQLGCPDQHVKIGRHHFKVIATSRDGLETTNTITYTVRRR